MMMNGCEDIAPPCGSPPSAAPLCMELTPGETQINEVYLKGIDEDISTIRQTFVDGMRGCGDLVDVEIPSEYQLVTSTFCVRGFNPGDSLDSMTDYCTHMFVNNPCTKAILECAGFHSAHVVKKLMKNTVTVWMTCEGGGRVFKFRVWKNGKISILKGAKTTSQLFSSAKLLSVMVHFGTMHDPDEACCTPIENFSVHLVNAPMRLVMKNPGQSLNVVALQHCIAAGGGKSSLRLNVFQNPRSDLQNQAHFEYAAPGTCKVLKTFVSGNGFMRINFVPHYPLGAYADMCDKVAAVLARFVPDCLTERTTPVSAAKRAVPCDVDWLQAVDGAVKRRRREPIKELDWDWDI